METVRIFPAFRNVTDYKDYKQHDQNKNNRQHYPKTTIVHFASFFTFKSNISDHISGEKTS